MMNFEKNSFYSFQKIRKNTKLMVKPWQNVTFWKVGYPNIFPENTSASSIVKNYHPQTSFKK